MIAVHVKRLHEVRIMRGDELYLDFDANGFDALRLTLPNGLVCTLPVSRRLPQRDDKWVEYFAATVASEVYRRLQDPDATGLQ